MDICAADAWRSGSILTILQCVPVRLSRLLESCWNYLELESTSMEPIQLQERIDSGDKQDF